MSGFVLTAVLFAALLHAAWNAIVKAGHDKLLDTLLVACSAALVCAGMLPFLPVPAMQSWPYILASAIIQLGYFALVAAVYRSADLSYVYPIMRGSAPLFTALAAGVFLAERLSAGGWAGVVLISGGILLLVAHQLRRGDVHWQPALLALCNAAVICMYTLVDGLGSRVSGNPFSYVAWLMAFNGAMLAAFLLLRHRAAAARRLRSRWLVCLGGGLCVWASYAIALWAMSRAPIALVAALRETSVVFATVLAAAVLKERFGATRYAAALLVCAGAIALKGF